MYAWHRLILNDQNQIWYQLVVVVVELLLLLDSKAASNTTPATPATTPVLPNEPPATGTTGTTGAATGASTISGLKPPARTGMEDRQNTAANDTTFFMEKSLDLMFSN